ncbi:hypothetical protein TrST_g2891 [Triparma strigata]|uniref:Uncharacterized protein n=1 Tax=Triparma strigata TaxID=1606541 RepID=A0A9W7BQQ5_9STRA|nr:hypothetical protein TrST_g2891 [Triparma strigata]
MLAAFLRPSQSLLNFGPRVKSRFASTLPSVIPGVSSLGGIILSTHSGGTLHLPPADPPVGPSSTGVSTYKKSYLCPSTNILRTSAHVGIDFSSPENPSKGTVGSGPTDIPIPLARELSRGSALRLLATLTSQVPISSIKQIISLRGSIREGHDFTSHGNVINAASEVFVEVLGPEKGVGVRSCNGAGGASGAAVSCEVEVMVEPPVEE